MKVRDSKTKSEAKLYIGRNGMKISFKAVPSEKEFFEGVASKMAEIVKSNDDLPYGELIELVAENFS